MFSFVRFGSSFYQTTQYHIAEDTDLHMCVGYIFVLFSVGARSPYCVWPVLV